VLASVKAVGRTNLSRRHHFEPDLLCSLAISGVPDHISSFQVESTPRNETGFEFLLSQLSFF